MEHSINELILVGRVVFLVGSEQIESMCEDRRVDLLGVEEGLLGYGQVQGDTVLLILLSTQQLQFTLTVFALYVLCIQLDNI